MEKLLKYLEKIFDDIEIFDSVDSIIEFEGDYEGLPFRGVCFYDEKERLAVILGFFCDSLNFCEIHKNIQ
jgi:hypothetical protein